MSIKIEELYSDEKYNLVVYYFKERGFLLIEDLKDFDFDELMFVPGVSVDLINEVQSLFQKNYCTVLASLEDTSNKAKTIQNNSKITAHEECFSTTIQIRVGSESRENSSVFQDASIADVYSKVPRSFSFVNRCSLKGKTMMSQLTEEDFNQAIGLRGIGKSTVKTLHNVYKEYIERRSSKASQEELILPKRLQDISIEEVFGSLPRGNIFIRFCRDRGIKTISDLRHFSFDASQVYGISEATMEKMRQTYLNVLNSPSVSPQEPVILKDVSQQNMKLSIRFLEYVGISQEDIKILNKNGFFMVENLCQNSLSPYYYSLIYKAVSFLTTPVTNHFLNNLANLKETVRKSLMQRSQGYTLQKIAEEIGVTRERVRQITEKACQSLIKIADMVADILMNDGKDSFAYSDLENLFADAVIADCCKYVLVESSEEIQYLSFSDKFVRKSLCPKVLDLALKQFSADVIGEGMNFYENLETIESELPKYGLSFLDFEDIMNYLVKNGYHFYGDYVIKGKKSYALICYDAIYRYFEFDIKLDADENNEDLALLRKIMNKHYHGLILPENNRALAARIASVMVLSGRGRYCPIEKVLYNTKLLDEVYNYIQESEQSSFYYSELFTRFKGRFLAETNISNAHFLHGILKYLYPEDFKYERDLLVKNNGIRQDIDDRLCALLIANKGPMTKAEIKKAIPGINDFVIAFAVARLPKLIQWEYNVFNHIDNISYDTNDIKKLRHILNVHLKRHNGYLSDTLIFNAVKHEYPQFIEKNKITNPLNLYYIIGYFFTEKCRFRRPHILSYDFPVNELTIANIAKTLLGCSKTLNYSSFIAVAESLGWAAGTTYSAFSELERDYFRISEDEYISRDALNFSDKFLHKTQQLVAKLVVSSGYYALSNIFSFNSFPEGQFKWNGFLLESIINEFDIGFKIINPQVRDRRYQRGIIVRKNALVNSFEELVIALLKKDGITLLTEIEMQKYLKNKGLISTNIVPQELYDYSALIFKNGQFKVQS